MKAKRRKRNKTNVTPEKKQKHLQTKNTPGGCKFAPPATCGLSTMANELARARLRWAFLSLALAVTFGHTNNTECRSSALTFPAAIYSAIKRSIPCSAVLRHSPSSSAAKRPLVSYTVVANPACGLLNRGKKTKRESMAAHPPPLTLLVRR